MIDATIIGLLAGTFTTVAFLPQVIKAFRTRSTHDISFPAFAILFTGNLLWFGYGIEINSLPVVLANGLTAILVFALLVLKLRFK